MIDFTHMTDYVWAAISMWIGYIHNELRGKPSREELEALIDVQEVYIADIKDDIQEIKSDIKYIRDKLFTPR